MARFGQRTGKHPQEQDRAKFGEFAREFVAIKTAIRWVDFEAGERGGAVNGTRLGLQQTATPPAFIMFVHWSAYPILRYGAVFGALTLTSAPFLQVFIAGQKYGAWGGAERS